MGNCSNCDCNYGDKQNEFDDNVISLNYINLNEILMQKIDDDQKGGKMNSSFLRNKDSTYT